MHGLPAGKFIMPLVRLSLAASQVYLFTPSCSLMASQAGYIGPTLVLPAASLC